MAELFCNIGQTLQMVEAYYGEFSCVAPSVYLDASTLSCGKDVSAEALTRCNGLNKCLLNVNDATFGNSGCEFGNFWAEYRCSEYFFLL